MSAPDKIYLQWADEESDEDYNEITWCVDQIDETDVEYCRITSEELAALRKENELLRGGAQLGPIVGAEVIRKQEVELAALRRAFAAACKYIDIVNNFCEQPGDEEEWIAARAEYDKCRAV